MYVCTCMGTGAKNIFSLYSFYFDMFRLCKSGFTPPDSDLVSRVLHLDEAKLESLESECRVKLYAPLLLQLLNAAYYAM